MTGATWQPRQTALLIVDLQNDFIHPNGAYARGGQAAPAIAALPARVAPLAQALRAAGGIIMATQFTLVPGRDGEPIISPHLKQLRPFLTKGDFAPGAWGHDVVEELHPIDVKIEKVAYSAFYMTRLEWVLRKLGISHLLACGIVTNGGVASTVRDAHVRDIDVTVIEDCCAAFTDAVHRAAIEGLRPVAQISSAEAVLAALNGAGA
jgi:nicotinamidase-related amidase